MHLNSSVEASPVDEALDNGHLSLAELLGGVTTSGVGERDRVADLDVVGKGDVLNLNIGRLPLVEEEESGVVGGDDVWAGEQRKRELGIGESYRIISYSPAGTGWKSRDMMGGTREKKKRRSGRISKSQVLRAIFRRGADWDLLERISCSCSFHRLTLFAQWSANASSTVLHTFRSSLSSNSRPRGTAACRVEEGKTCRCLACSVMQGTRQQGVGRDGLCVYKRGNRCSFEPASPVGDPTTRARPSVHAVLMLLCRALASAGVH